MTQRIKACLFDLGNVLVFFSHEKMHRQLAEVTGLTPAAVRDLLAQGSLQWRYEAGELTTAEFLAALRRGAPRAFTDAEALIAASDIFALNAPMLPLLEKLKGRGQRLVIVSNTNAAHMDFARPRFPIFPLFDAAVYSYAVHAMKPAPGFYRAAEAAAGCRADECFFTDDLQANVDGASRHGFVAALFTGAGALASRLQELDILD